MTRAAYDVMDRKLLHCFFAMARHGSLTRAGTELDISEAAVSQRIRSPEIYLGTKLYETRGGRVQLTTAGARTARLAVSVFSEIEALEQAVNGAQETAEIALASHDSCCAICCPTRSPRFTEPIRWRGCG